MSEREHSDQEDDVSRRSFMQALGAGGVVSLGKYDLDLPDGSAAVKVLAGPADAVPQPRAAGERLYFALDTGERLYDTGAEWVPLDLTAPSVAVEDLKATEATIEDLEATEAAIGNAAIEGTLTASDASFENLGVGQSIDTQEGYISGMLTEPLGAAQVSISPGTAIAADGKTIIRADERVVVDLDTTGSGGRQEGEAVSPNTWYAVFVIADADGENPAGFLVNETQSVENPKAVRRRVGWVRTDGNGSILPFRQAKSDRWIYQDDRQPVRTGNPVNGGTWVNVDLSEFIPPTADGAIIRMLASGDGTAGGRTAITARDPFQTQAPSLEAAAVSESTNFVARETGEVTVDEVPSFDYNTFNAGGVIIRVAGWTEERLTQEPFGSEGEFESRISAQAKWDMVELFDREGGSLFRGFADVNGDGTADLICNIGLAADFAAISQDNEVIWRNTIDQTKQTPAYYPKVVEDEGAFFFGTRGDNKVYCGNLSDGSIRWSYTANGNLRALELSDVGVVVGSKGADGEVTILDLANGSHRSGWPVSFSQHPQALGAGDLDGDGQDEIVINDNNGTIQVRNRDGSLLYEINSGHSHVDLHFVGNIDPNNSGNEYLSVIDDDGSVGGEGDEITTFDAQGNRINKYESASGGANLAVGDVRTDLDGREIAFGLEGSAQVGLLDAQLNPLWTTRIPSVGGAAGQLAMADIDGDGNLEILANTGENANAGFVVLSGDGEILAQRDGWGWDFDPMYTKRNAAIDSKQFVDVDGEGRDEVHASRVGGTRANGREIIRLMEIVEE